jgi:hypothetical protein
VGVGAAGGARGGCQGAAASTWELPASGYTPINSMNTVRRGWG